MDPKNLLIEKNQGIALVKINRPQALNALNPEVLGELQCLFTGLSSDAAVRVIILTGSGEKAFVAGADITAMKTMGALEAKKFCDLGHETMQLIENCPKPVIAAVNGFALGGGLELALACDFIYAAENAKLGLPEVNLGIFPGFGGTQRLSRLIGKNKAKELIFSARMLSAQEALSWGIVNKVVAAPELLAETRKVAETLLTKGPLAIRLAKQAINEGADLDIQSGLNLERGIFPMIFATADQKEGVTAFLEKRAANFKGE